MPNTVIGPGLSTAANSSWKDVYNTYPSHYYFSVYATGFTSQAQLSIENILNEANYLSYIVNLFTGSSGRLNAANGKLMITELAMIEGTGVDGVTNAMVSAIWALDIMLEGAKYGLKRIQIKADPSSTDFVSMFGSAPNYEPQPIYYAMLMMSIIQQDSNTYFITPTVS